MQTSLPSSPNSPISNWLTGFYTGVGSRETPQDILDLIVRLAYRLGELGWCLRSGGADGCDTAFFEGAKLAHSPYEIFLPWKGFNGHHHTAFIDATQLPTYPQAVEIASQIHPTWSKLTRGPRALHTRNVFQVLGSDLTLPSKALVCWAPPVGRQGFVKGGTNTAVTLALRHQIPVLNLYYDEIVERALTLIAQSTPESIYC